MDGSSTTTRKSRNRTERVEERFRSCLAKGNYYEAQQTLHVLYERYISQGRNENGWSLLYTGASQLLASGQWESGTEVALLIVDHLKKWNPIITADIMDKLENLFRCYKFIEDKDYVTHPQLPSLRVYPSIATLSKEEASRLHVMQVNREMFMKAALKWTSLVNKDMKYGHVRLHKLLALAYFEEGEFVRARKHFLYASMPEEFGVLLVEMAEKEGYPEEVEMFITQAVLQLLVLGSKEDAFKTYMKYCSQHSLVKPFMPPPFPHLPLINFTWFLMLSLDIGDTEVFHCLCSCYSQVIHWDPSYSIYLTKIGEAYFGLKPAPKPQGIMELLTGGNFDSLLTSFGEPPPVHHQQPSQQLADINLSETAEGLD